MIRLLLIAFSFLLLASCGGNSKMKGMSDFELAQKNSACLSGKPTAPGKATACENVRKECERRRKELKNYAC
ncbi:MAG: hypothetical protein ACRBCS_04150 [Cellvibrionaceae bacterium]